MSAPIITIVNDADQTIANWDCGTVQANNDSAILTVRIWNNKAQTSAVSDLKDASITTLDIDGGVSSDVVSGKWVQINAPYVDGNETTWTQIGGSTLKYVRADGCNAADGYVIRGTANDGSATNAKVNYATCRLKVHVPLNATPGVKTWKTRLNGYYV